MMDAQVWLSMFRADLAIIYCLESTWDRRPSDTDYELLPIGDDIWVTRGNVEEHIDGYGIREGFLTQGLILAGSNDLTLTVEGQSIGKLTTGSMYYLDPLKPHAVESTSSETFLGFLAWDLPEEEVLEPRIFVREALPTVKQTLMQKHPRLWREAMERTRGVV
jgi:hypothetical protein